MVNGRAQRLRRRRRQDVHDVYDECSAAAAGKNINAMRAPNVTQRAAEREARRSELLYDFMMNPRLFLLHWRGGGRGGGGEMGWKSIRCLQLAVGTSNGRGIFSRWRSGLFKTQYVKYWSVGPCKLSSKVYGLILIQAILLSLYFLVYYECKAEFFSASDMSHSHSVLG